VNIVLVKGRIFLKSTETIKVYAKNQNEFIVLDTFVVFEIW